MVQHRLPYRSPFDVPAEDLSGHARMLRRVEPSIRARLEDQRISKRVALWVAGGRTWDQRARRADVAVYVRGRLVLEGWPELWILAYFAAADATVCANRRARGMPRYSVEEMCAGVTLPEAPPPPRRTTKKQREAKRKEKLAERLRKLATEIEKIEELGPVSW
jgi:hypothetical protein